MHRSTTTPAGLRKVAAIAATALLAASGVTVVTQTAQASTLPTIALDEVESSDTVEKDWVELKNIGSDPVDISGWIVKDDNGSRTKAIPADTTIAPGGYFTFVVDEAPNGFGPGAADNARLYLAEGTTLVDETSWTAHATYTWGRCADGTGAFVQTTASTKDATNACPVPADPASVLKINEVEANGGTPVDWIELVNTGTESVDAGGLILKDNDDTHVFAIPTPEVAAAGGHVTFDVDVAGGFGLDGADSARLFTADGTTLIDSTSWTALGPLRR